MIIDPLIPSAPRRVHAHRVAIGDAVFGADRVPIVAGPCAVEPGFPDHARLVAAAGAAALRGCIFKPRTSPRSFQGLGESGIGLVAEARAATGLPVLVEPLEPAHVDALSGRADALMIGARSMHNAPLLRAAGRSGLPVVVKRGMSATCEEWVAAADYVRAEGNDQVILCERGIRTFETATRNTLDLSAIAVLRDLTDLPVIVDPSHATGRASWVAPLALAAVAAGADGLLIECHPHPDRSMCDAAQAITPARLADIARATELLAAVSRPAVPATVGGARDQLDAVDTALAQLLERRARLVGAVAELKADAGMAARDPIRERDVIARVQRHAPTLGAAQAARLMRAVIDACVQAGATDVSDRDLAVAEGM